MEALESRRLLDAVLSGDTLTVTGTSLADNIQLFDRDQGGNLPNQLHAIINGHEDVFTEPGVKHVLISGLAGDDVIKVSLGFFTMFTTASPVTVAGGAGNDSITGGVEDDTIFGGHGNDTIVNGGGGDGIYAGGPGDDLLIGDNDGIHGHGRFHGGPGNDTIRLFGAEDESAQGDSGINTLDFSGTLERVQFIFDGKDDDGLIFHLMRAFCADGKVFSPGKRRIIEGSVHVVDDFERIIGGPKDDYIVGDKTAETIVGGGGNDTIHGGGGNDLIYGGTGHDKLFGDGGADQLIGAEPGGHTQVRDTLDGGGDPGDIGDGVSPDLLRDLKIK